MRSVDSCQSFVEYIPMQSCILLAWILGVIDEFNVCFPGGGGALHGVQGPRRARLHQLLQGLGAPSSTTKPYADC